MNGKTFPALALLASLLTSPLPATVVMFENVKLPAANEMDGLQAVKGYGDHVSGVSSGGFANSFARGNGWTPNISLDFSAGKDRKTVSSWRAGWDGGDGANYLLDGDPRPRGSGPPWYYWYTFTPRNRAGVTINSLDLDGVGNHTNRVDWKIYAGSRAGKVLASGSTGNFSGDKEKVELGMKSPHFGVVVLELIRSGARTTLAIDNLDFDEAPPGRTADSAIEVGNRKQLFVDDYVISAMTGLSRDLGKPVKLNGGKPVFDGWFYGTVLHDEGKFKLWYRGNPYGYAESKDGIHFRRIAKLVGLDTARGDSATFYIDPHEKNPAHRYKACYAHSTIRAALSYSADGIHWKPYNNGKPVTGRAADTTNHITWDEDAKVYRLFTRTDYPRPPDGLEVRGTRSMTNPDIKSDPTGWKLVRDWKFDREGPEECRRRQIYGLSDWIYHGVHFAQMMVFEWPNDLSEGPVDYHKRHERDVLEYYIATSRDGDNWDLSWVYAGKRMITRGPDGSWDKDMVIPSSEIITHNDKHWLYYSGSNERHGAPRPAQGIGVAALRLDGFVFLEAGARMGSLTTKPFRLEGKRLQINVAGEKFRVEILDEKGRPLPGFSGPKAETISNVDNLRLEPRWKGSLLSELKGRMVRLKFHLEKARLYSFQVPR